MGVRWNKELSISEKYCGKCGQWWPATSEFFQIRRGMAQLPCIACREEKRARTNAVTPCCVPGCSRPRADSKSSRCKAHKREKQKEYYARWQAKHRR